MESARRRKGGNVEESKRRGGGTRSCVVSYAIRDFSQGLSWAVRVMQERQGE